MKIKEVIKTGKNILKRVSDAPLLEAEVLFSFVSKKSRAFVISHFEDEVNPSLKDTYFKMVHKREQGVPFHYVTNKKEFMGLEFFVDRRVLIPRQETETLVERALEIAMGKKVNVLDIGTGSGCILVSFFYYNKKSFGTGIDISESALEVAVRNAKALGVSGRARFVKSDFRDFNSEEKFDLVLSNPPYVMKSEMKNVPFEPEIALFGGERGIDIYPDLAEKIHALLKDNGVFIVEIDYRNAEEIFKIFKNAGLKRLVFLKDLSGRVRFIEGRIS